MTSSHSTLELDLQGVECLAQILALKLQRGDCVFLRGDLGAGKTTLARALIRARLDDRGAEVPSPTFSLVQVYEARGVPLSHFDLYRVRSGEEAEEIGIAQAIDDGIVLVEWPDLIADLAPEGRLEIVLSSGRREDVRKVSLLASGAWADRCRRILAIFQFVQDLPDWRAAQIMYLQGDASARAYARLRNGESTAVLMDAPRMPDGPPVRDGMPYSRIAHLAEDVRPFVAIAQALDTAGLSVPGILAQDLDAGLLLIEDLGDRVFGVEMRAATDQAILWKAATDVLIELRRVDPPTVLRTAQGEPYALPRFDRAALEIELDLLLDWFWPSAIGTPPSIELRAEFQSLWAPILDRLLALPAGWFLRDYHSPNLLWLPERPGIRNVGVIDFQDALAEPWAYDLVSLLQDARVDVSKDLERELLAHYCDAVTAFTPGFDRDSFSFAYHAFGAQRRTRHIGLFVRLFQRDGKSQYLQHIPRAWEHLDRCLTHPDLAEIRRWYDRWFPPMVRSAVSTP